MLNNQLRDSLEKLQAAEIASASSEKQHDLVITELRKNYENREKEFITSLQLAEENNQVLRRGLQQRLDSAMEELDRSRADHVALKKTNASLDSQMDTLTSNLNQLQKKYEESLRVHAIFMFICGLSMCR